MCHHILIFKAGCVLWGDLYYIKGSNNRNYVSKDPAAYLLPAASGGFLAASKSNVGDSAAKSAVLCWCCVDGVGCDRLPACTTCT